MEGGRERERERGATPQDLVSAPRNPQRSYFFINTTSAFWENDQLRVENDQLRVSGLR